MHAERYNNKLSYYIKGEKKPFIKNIHNNCLIQCTPGIFHRNQTIDYALSVQSDTHQSITVPLGPGTVTMNVETGLESLEMIIPVCIRLDGVWVSPEPHLSPAPQS